MFIAVLFIIAKIWKQLMSLSRWVDKKAVAYVHNGILLNHKEEGNLTFWDNVDEPEEHYAKWNKPEKNKYHMILLICGI